MDKRIKLDIGLKLQLENEEGEKNSFEIHSYLGEGGNSIVYNVNQGEFEYGILKEFYPAIDGIYRTSENDIIIDKIENETEKKSYEKRKKAFAELIIKRNILRSKSANISNTMPEYCRLFSGNNTLYLFQSYKSGICYSEVHLESMSAMLNTIIGLVNSIRCYHKAGYVHLDIKPENMLLIAQGDNSVGVQLFDFETVTLIADLKEGKIKTLPKSKYYISPEHKLNNYTKIDVYSDIYSVGVIVFYKIMGRFPDESRELQIGAKYKYDDSLTIFDGVAPIIKRYLDDFFSHTIRIVEQERYQDDDALINSLRELLKLSEKGKGIIQKDNYKRGLKILFGRIEELVAISNAIRNNNFIFIYGIAGIGKSELVKHFLNENEYDYEKIIYIEETGNNIRNVIINDDYLKIDGLTRVANISDDDYFDIKVELIKQEYIEIKKSKKELIFVFDNTECFEDLKYIEKITEIGCKVIIISRGLFDGLDFDNKIEIKRIKNNEDIKEMFISYYENDNLSDEDIEVLEEIINYYNGHTLIMELMAKGMLHSWVELKEIKNKICNMGNALSGNEKIPYVKNNVVEQKRIEDIVYDMYDFGSYSQDEMEVFKFMSILPIEGISKRDFKLFFDNIAIVKTFIKMGMVEEDRNSIRIHPIVREMLISRHPLSKNEINKYVRIIKELLLCKNNFDSIENKRILLYVNIGHNLTNIADIDDADFYSVLANACKRIGQNEYTAEYYKKSAEILKNQSDVDDEKIAFAYMNCGEVLRNNGDYQKSKEFLDRSTDYYSKSPIMIALGLAGGVVGGVIGDTMFGLGSMIPLLGKSIFFNGFNNTVEDDTKYRHSERKIIQSKKDVVRIVKKYIKLSTQYFEQGELESAMQCCETANAILNRQYDDYTGVNKYFYHIDDIKANILFEMENYQEALYLYNVSYERKESICDINNICFSYSYLGIAKCNYMLKQYDKALKYILQAINISEKIRGIDNIETAKIYHYAAKIYEKCNNIQGADMYYNQAIMIEMRMLGKSNIFTILSEVDYLKFAQIYKKQFIVKEKYDEIKFNIISKERPNIGSIKRLYEDMREISKLLNYNDDYWDKCLEQYMIIEDN